MLYTVECNKCKKESEFLVRFDKIRITKFKCLYCNSTDTKQAFKWNGVYTIKGDNSASTPRNR